MNILTIDPGREGGGMTESGRMEEFAKEGRWLLALESSTPHGGAALLRDGLPVATARLEEGLRHGRELVSAAAGLLEGRGLSARDLAGVAVSAGPGSYTGVRVGMMAAKALAYGAGCRLATVSSLAALALSLMRAGGAGEGDMVMVAQDARRDEVYAGLYSLSGGEARPELPDAAITPEEAAFRCREALAREGARLRLAGSGFATYRETIAAGLAGLDAASILAAASDGRVDPASVGILGWRRMLREEYADPMQAQPVYLRRDEGADWRHDHLIPT